MASKPAFTSYERTFTLVERPATTASILSTRFSNSPSLRLNLHSQMLTALHPIRLPTSQPSYRLAFRTQGDAGYLSLGRMLRTHYRQLCHENPRSN